MLTIQRIIDAAAVHFGITTADILGRDRHKTIATARHTAMFIARATTCASYPELARIFNRDHTTVLNGVRTIQGWLDIDQPQACADVAAVRRILETAVAS